MFVDTTKLSIIYLSIVTLILLFLATQLEDTWKYIPGMVHYIEYHAW